MPYKTLSLENPAPGVALVYLDRPAVANALNMQMGKELAAVFKGFGRDVRAVAVAGHGTHFCAGADLKERRGMDKKAWDAQHHAFEQAFGALRACPAPVIAAVHGAAMGGGLELALACDFIYAADNARFALPEVTLGIMPGLGGAEALSRAVGSARAKELLFTGKPFSAEEAYRMGMVNRLLPQETVLEETLATARTIAANAPLAVKAIKKTLRRPQRSELAEYAKLLTTKDRHEGIKAFHEKRKPVFVGK